MEILFQNSQQETKQMETEALRANFLLQNLWVNEEIQLVYTHYDRIIIGGIKPLNKTLTLQTPAELKANYFLERREAGIINVGGLGVVETDEGIFSMKKLDALYIGKGIKQVSFKSANANEPALFYFLSAPAHQAYPVKKLTKEQAMPVLLGDTFTANKRTIYKYIHADGLQSCQLVMGLTVLDEGSVWNTMPAHTHTRRTEVYFYFDVQAQQRVFHLMGTPQQTRHLIVANHQSVVSPPWSIHSGCGTANYGFIWGMAGENLAYTDMDPAPLETLQ